MRWTESAARVTSGDIRHNIHKRPITSHADSQLAWPHDETCVVTYCVKAWQPKWSCILCNLETVTIDEDEDSES